MRDLFRPGPLEDEWRNVLGDGRAEDVVLARREPREQTAREHDRVDPVGGGK